MNKIKLLGCSCTLLFLLQSMAYASNLILDDQNTEKTTSATNRVNIKTNMKENMPVKYGINSETSKSNINQNKEIASSKLNYDVQENKSTVSIEHEAKNDEPLAEKEKKSEREDVAVIDTENKGNNDIAISESKDNKDDNVYQENTSEKSSSETLEVKQKDNKADTDNVDVVDVPEEIRITAADLSVVKEKIRAKKTHKRQEYGSDVVFANFREVTTTGMASGILYRTSNPLSIDGNKVRHEYADALAESVGINTELNVAETDGVIKSYINKKAVRDKYCAELYRQGRVLGAPLDGITSRATAWPNMAKVLRFMIANDGPYLIHCNEGKDRAGFLAVLLEALAGASREEIKKDYMKSFENYYHIVPGSREYEVINRYQGDYQIFVMANTKYASQGLKVDLDKMDISNIIPEKAAIRYCRHALKLTEEEISLLQNKLRGKI